MKLYSFTVSIPHEEERDSTNSFKDVSALGVNVEEFDKYPITIALSKSLNCKLAPIPPVLPSYIAPFSSKDRYMEDLEDKDELYSSNKES